jgi:hypothetical protein
MYDFDRAILSGPTNPLLKCRKFSVEISGINTEHVAEELN